MEFENLKRIHFIQSLIVILSGYYLLKVLVEMFFLKAFALEDVVNYLIMVILYSLISQLLKAEKFFKLNNFTKTELVLFIGLFLLIISEIVFQLKLL